MTELRGSPRSKEAGGIAIVQDPEEAFAPSMPQSARALVAVDHVLSVREMGVLITELTKEETRAPATRSTAPHVAAMEPDLARPVVALHESDRPGKVSIFTCPECHGTVWEVDQRGIVRFRCRVGHVYSAESMLAAQTDSVDRALWMALRSLEERAALTHRLAERAEARQHRWVARAFNERAQAADTYAAVIRELLVNRSLLHEVPDAEPETPDGGESAPEEQHEVRPLVTVSPVRPSEE